MGTTAAAEPRRSDAQRPYSIGAKGQAGVYTDAN